MACNHSAQDLVEQGRYGVQHESYEDGPVEDDPDDDDTDPYGHGFRMCPEPFSEGHLVTGSLGHEPSTYDADHSLHLAQHLI